MARKCSWCNRLIGDNAEYWYKNVYEDGKSYKSREIFCSPKCSHEYPYAPTANKSGNLGTWLVLIIVGVIIYLVISNKNENSNQIISEQSAQTQNIAIEEAPLTDNIMAVDTTTSNNVNADIISEEKIINFVNHTNNTVFLTIAYFNNSGWESHGQYKIEHNDFAHIELPKTFNDEFIYWYAMNDIGQEWSGNDKTFCISPDEIDSVIYEADSESCLEFSKGFQKLILNDEMTLFELKDE
jgi:uncharacterized membrane protein